MNRLSFALQPNTLSRIPRMLLGNTLIGVGVACYRLALFGVDAFTCMNLGVSGFVGISFGNWQLLVNLAMLLAVFFLSRKSIGLGTLVNMVCVGYIADFLCWLLLTLWGLLPTLPLRILFLILGVLLAALGCALYMDAGLGTAPYDTVAPILVNLTRGKLSFRLARIISDVTAISIGVAFCLLARNDLREIIGIGTLINALCSGPLIQFFRTHFPPKNA